jgi:ADP-heptose:LPS heptosyltransferase
MPDWTIPGDGRIALIHMGGLGDLVLASEFVARAKAGLPEAHLTLICRSEFSSITEIFPVAPDETLALPFNPYDWDRPTPELHRELEPIARRLQGRATDLLLDLSLSALWFTWLVGAILRPRSAACSAVVRPYEQILNNVLDQFGLACPDIERIEARPGLHERDRYRSLADRLGCPPAACFPWSVPDRARSLARNWLEEHELAEGRYVACFPGSSGHPNIRRWKGANFVNVLDRLGGERNLAILLFGSAAERPDLEEIARLTTRPTAVFGGQPDDVVLAAGLLGLARGVLGNDSGPAHLAQAFDVPGVVIFGGGGLPTNYACWGAGSNGVIHPLPCFGCAWDCFIGRGLCIESIPVLVVADAVNRVLDNPGSVPKMTTVDSLEQPILEVLTAASRRIRDVQSDRDRRIAVMVEMDARMAILGRAAEERLEVLNRIHGEAERRDQQIRDLTRELADRDRAVAEYRGEMEARLITLEQIAAERLSVLESVHAEAQRRGKTIEELTDRLRALEQPGRARAIRPRHHHLRDQRDTDE